MNNKKVGLYIKLLEKYSNKKVILKENIYGNNINPNYVYYMKKLISCNDQSGKEQVVGSLPINNSWDMLRKEIGIREFKNFKDWYDSTGTISNQEMYESKKNKINHYIKLLEKYSGKKVKFLKEADEATKNAAINNIQFLKTSLENSIDKIDELTEMPIMNKERNILINQISQLIGKINEKADILIENITGVVSQEQEEKPLEEDVAMSTDDIIKNPDTVKKLSDKKIDIKVKDPNMRSSITKI